MIKIEFTEAELQSLVGLLDAGVRASGLRGVKEAAVLLDKLERAANGSLQASQEASKPE